MTTSQLTGVVRDASGAVVPGAQVEITNVATNAARTIPTDDSGSYTFVNLATVLLNDRLLGMGYVGRDPTGYIGIQAESGAIEFRSILIKEGAGPIPPRSWDGFVKIFDGKTFNGWEPERPGGEKPFSIPQDGVLRVNGRLSIGVRGEPLPADLNISKRPPCSGNLVTEQEYSDFTLRFEVRYTSCLADSGFFVRMMPPDAQAGPNQGGGTRGYQLELQGMGTKDLPWQGLVYAQGAVPQGMTMFNYDAAMKTYLPIGQWVSYEVQAFGPTVVTKVNGLVVGRAEDVYPKGKFGIQCEVNTVEYRNIQVREGTE
jgi:3-keto-disaccharide hydrolase/Carboxypeptidase regulatory-like domain